MAVQYREYRKEYQSLLDGAYGIQDHNANERGIRLALETAVLPDLIIKLYTEHYTYPWLKSLMINRLRGLKNELSLDYIPVKNSKLTMRFYHKKASAKSSDNKDWFDKALFYTSYKYSIRIRHLLSASFSIKSQFDYTIVRSGGIEGDDSRGSLLALDIFYHPTLLPVKLSFRYAIFNTDDFSSRLYAYENDVLYASSMPAYYGKGYRSYLLIKYKASQWLDAWLRLSLTRFTDRNTISSGPAEIGGNKLPEIKIQLRLKL